MEKPDRHDSDTLSGDSEGEAARERLSDAEYQKQSLVLYDYLVMSCNGDALDQVAAVKVEGDGYAAWQALIRFYESRTQTMFATLQGKLFDHNRRLEDGGDVRAYLNEIEDIRKQLVRMGKSPDEDLLLGQIIRGLPESYRPVVAAMQVAERITKVN